MNVTNLVEFKVKNKIERLKFFRNDFEKTIRHIISDNNVYEDLIKTKNCGDFNFRVNMNLNLSEKEINEIHELSNEMIHCLREYEILLNKKLNT